ncbi:secreted protein [Pseudonocardia sp. Ae406_Ps2]|uniref:DUF3048 domain-containing protein n=1 Tax=unclassified Pseudonocardia TaxID=2619320 RepID=UPI00094ABC1A|nr:MULTISPECIES: DUF3048 domain-containing protein [unclassified Pseudonocardia]OLM00004.1 secreted protein [Pseudonocardia sp. Ae406_Ps2]OLM08204.1 secreted protein [Pseudonocardia sp. Ae331_Ps2]OLM13562.1 secreted protein [Pseudonocardia sp. Ae505_Ps2]OLM21572.1 secreted protein [Pseudonocardia sp. Ae706_Ps2]
MRAHPVVAALLGLVLTGAVGCAPSPAVPVPVTAPATPAPLLSPLTGLPSEPGARVFAVKIDNTAAARPWDGVEAADVVYVEPVEGGLTRLLAVFASQLPRSVGPVRSARETDIGVLGAYGRPALVFSGAAPPVMDRLRAAAVVPVVSRDLPEAFRRDDRRPAPLNVYVDLTALRGRVPQAGPVQDIGLRFGPAPDGGAPVPQRSVRVGATTVTVTWSAQDDTWTVATGDRTAVSGPDRRPVRADTVVVQRVAVAESSVRDSAGSVSPIALTVGAGEAEVLREGRSFPARWSRPAVADPLRLTTPDGREMPVRPGHTWVLLAAR